MLLKLPHPRNPACRNMNRIRSVPSLAYYRRIFSAYLLGGKSHLTFWHETPTENPNATPNELGEYYMLFAEKADYRGHYDASGVPQLDYHGAIGLQHNPIAIAQYGRPEEKKEILPDR